MGRKYKVFILFVLFTIVVDAGSWKMKINKHGVVLKSSNSTLYLGKDCDATSTRYGKGSWRWSEEKVSVNLDRKNYSLNIGLAYPKSKCYSPEVVKRNYNPQYVEVVIPKDKCVLIVASRKNMRDVKDYIDENITNTRYLNIYRSSNGWYAVSIGFLDKTQKKSTLKSWKRVGKIPHDSLCSNGSRYLYEVSPNGTIQKVLSNKKGAYRSTNSSSHKRGSNRTLLCLAKTWGPDVCSHKFNEFAKRKMDIEVNDMINSPVCATLISEVLNEPVTSSDIKVAVLTGMLDEVGSSGIESDNLLFNIAGGISYFYSFSIKLSLFNECVGQ